ncbi:MAG: winged helix-turn-helix domain-containing protein [Candidatus Solibacter sp.]|nr:winged helix-turn-helix domain-containing protein [Candidatus Solibacter sp.]
MDVRSPIRFGAFEVDFASGELRKHGVRVRLQEQPFQVLVALLDRPREVVSREDLQKRLWPSDVVVDFDRGLNKAINRLREVLEDDAGNPRLIETLPQRGYRFLAEVQNTPQPAPSRIASIAVLPLENLSDNPSDEYFSDGMTDELIGEIARIGSLRVISRTSIMQYKKGIRKSLPVIARELNVDAILEGTVSHSHQKVRITAQLIRAHDDRHLWSERYERPVADILALQSEVARAIARPVNPEAYDAFLKGTFFLHQGIRGTGRSIEFFEQAIELDPLLAGAHVGLAEALCFSGIFGLRPSAETYPEARLAALKALQLDDSNAGAHNVLADVKQGYDWDLAGAESEFKRALELNPSHLLTRLRPVSPISYVSRAMVFFRARRYDEAIQASRQALDLDPSNVNGLWWQGVSYAGKRDFPNSVTALTKALSMADGPLFRGYLGFVFGQAGERAKALGILKELARLSGERFVSPVDFAVVHAGLGDADSTFLWLEKAVQARETRIELASMYFDSFRSDPRYVDLIRRLGLPLPAPAEGT